MAVVEMKSFSFPTKLGMVIQVKMLKSGGEKGLIMKRDREQDGELVVPSILSAKFYFPGCVTSLLIYVLNKLKIWETK